MIIGYVMIKADVAAKTVGLMWLGTGIVVLAVFHLSGRAPQLAGSTRRSGLFEWPPACRGG